jgi:hypothetical protein
LFAQAFADAANDMRRAAARLASGETAKSALAAQASAIDRLERLIAAVAPSDTPHDAPRPTGASTNAPGAENEGPIHVVEELRLVKLLQESINARTRDLEARRASGERQSALQAELDGIAAEQARLRTVLVAIFEPSQGTPGQPEPMTPKRHDDDGPSPVQP